MPAKKKCAVSLCDNNSIDNPGLLFHRFPAKRERSSSWRTLCGNPSLSAVSADELGLRWLFVCSSHFHENDYTNALRNRLNSNAFPTLLLPQQDLETSTDNNEGTSVPHVSSAPSTSTLPCDSSVENVSDAFLTTPIIIPDSIPNTAEPSPSVPSVTPIPSTFVECSLPSPSTSSVTLETPTRSTSSFHQHDPSTPTMSAIRRVPMNSGSSSHKGRRFSLLESINLTSAVDFTPRKKKLVNVIRSQRKSISKFRRMSIAIRRKYQNILNFRGDTFVEHLEQNLPTSFTQFLRTQLRIAGKKPKGRRWTNEEKIMALPLYKKSPKAYTLLRSFVPLPSKRTLNSLLQQIPFSTGVHADLVSHLSIHASEMAEEDKFCTLLFDEMSVKQHLFFDSHHDRIDGFEDLGKGGKTNQVAKYALVFMVRALFGNWKQPVAYYFSHNSTSALTISTMLKEIVPLIMSSGLKVMATVCDMGTNNVRALKLLGASFQSPFFSIGDTKIFTVFDPPHLLKCFRNLFLKHDVQIGVEVGGNTINRVAKWQHILATYADQVPPFQDLKRLTKRHLDPKLRDKMRVYLAAQVMSNSVACAVNHRVSSGVLGSDGVATATFLLLCDEVFDSLNGSLHRRDRCKVLKGPVTSSSPHFKFWETAIKRIDSIKFLSCGRRPPSQDGWLATIRAVRMLWKVVLKEGFHHLETRKLNQDPLENLFGIIRQNCGQNHHPNVPQFVSALKTALIDGFSAPSTRHNCELDEGKFLSNLKSFLEKGLGSSSSEIDSASDTSAIAYSKMQDRFFQTSLEGIRVESIAYVSSYICQRLMKDCSCNDCKSSITSDFLFACNILTSFHDVDYESGQFPLPSEEMVAAMVHGTNILESVMPRVAHTDKVCQQLTSAILHSVDFSFLKCLAHRDKLKQEMSLFLSQIFAYRYCKNVNSSLESPP